MPIYSTPYQNNMSAIRRQIADIYGTPDLRGNLPSNEFTRGLVSTSLGLEANRYHEEELAAIQRGDYARAEEFRAKAEAALQRAAVTSPQVQDFTDVLENSGRGGLNWALGAGGSALASMIPSFSYGTLGRALGGAIGSRFGIGGTLANVGGAIGAAAPAYQMERNEAIGEAMRDPVIRKKGDYDAIRRTAETKGVAAGSLESLVPYALTKGMISPLNKAIKGKGLNAGIQRGGIIEAAVGEGLTEGSQSLVGQAAQNYLRGDPLTNFDYKQAFNEAMAGVVGGGMTAVPAKGINYLRDKYTSDEAIAAREAGYNAIGGQGFEQGYETAQNAMDNVADTASALKATIDDSLSRGETPTQAADNAQQVAQSMEAESVSVPAEQTAPTIQANQSMSGQNTTQNIQPTPVSAPNIQNEPSAASATPSVVPTAARTEQTSNQNVIDTNAPVYRNGPLPLNAQGQYIQNVDGINVLFNNDGTVEDGSGGVIIDFRNPKQWRAAEFLSGQQPSIVFRNEAARQIFAQQQTQAYEQARGQMQAQQPSNMPYTEPTPEQYAAHWQQNGASIHPADVNKFNHQLSYISAIAERAKRYLTPEQLSLLQNNPQEFAKKYNDQVNKLASFTNPQEQLAFRLNWINQQSNPSDASSFTFKRSEEDNAKRNAYRTLLENFKSINALNKNVVIENNVLEYFENNPSRALSNLALLEQNLITQRKGTQFYTKGLYDGDKVHIFLDRAKTKEALIGTFLHELGSHAGMEKILGDKLINKLAKQINDWNVSYNKKKQQGTETTLEENIAKLAVENASYYDENHKIRETVAHFIGKAISEYNVNPTIFEIENNQIEKSALRNLLQKVLDACRNFLRKLGVKPETLTTQEIVDFAWAAAAERTNSPITMKNIINNSEKIVNDFGIQKELEKENTIADVSALSEISEDDGGKDENTIDDEKTSAATQLAQTIIESEEGLFSNDLKNAANNFLNGTDDVRGDYILFGETVRDLSEKEYNAELLQDLKESLGYDESRILKTKDNVDIGISEDFDIDEERFVWVDKKLSEFFNNYVDNVLKPSLAKMPVFSIRSLLDHRERVESIERNRKTTKTVKQVQTRHGLPTKELKNAKAVPIDEHAMANDEETTYVLSDFEAEVVNLLLVSFMTDQETDRIKIADRMIKTASTLRKIFFQKTVPLLEAVRATLPQVEIDVGKISENPDVILRKMDNLLMEARTGEKEEIRIIGNHIVENLLRPQFREAFYKKTPEQQERDRERYTRILRNAILGKEYAKQPAVYEQAALGVKRKRIKDFLKVCELCGIELADDVKSVDRFLVNENFQYALEQLLQAPELRNPVNNDFKKLSEKNQQGIIRLMTSYYNDTFPRLLDETTAMRQARVYFKSNIITDPQNVVPTNEEISKFQPIIEKLVGKNLTPRSNVKGGNIYTDIPDTMDKLMLLDLISDTRRAISDKLRNLLPAGTFIRMGANGSVLNIASPQEDLEHFDTDVTSNPQESKTQLVEEQSGETFLELLEANETTGTPVTEVSLQVDVDILMDFREVANAALRDKLPIGKAFSRLNSFNTQVGNTALQNSNNWMRRNGALTKSGVWEDTWKETLNYKKQMLKNYFDITEVDMFTGSIMRVAQERGTSIDEVIYSPQLWKEALTMRTPYWIYEFYNRKMQGKNQEQIFTIWQTLANTPRPAAKDLRYFDDLSFGLGPEESFKFATLFYTARDKAFKQYDKGKYVAFDVVDPSIAAQFAYYMRFDDELFAYAVNRTERQKSMDLSSRDISRAKGMSSQNIRAYLNKTLQDTEERKSLSTFEREADNAIIIRAFERPAIKTNLHNKENLRSQGSWGDVAYNITSGMKAVKEKNKEYRTQERTADNPSDTSTMSLFLDFWGSLLTMRVDPDETITNLSPFRAEGKEHMMSNGQMGALVKHKDSLSGQGFVLYMKEDNELPLEPYHYEIVWSDDTIPLPIGVNFLFNGEKYKALFNETYNPTQGDLQAIAHEVVNNVKAAIFPTYDELKKLGFESSQKFIGNLPILLPKNLQLWRSRNGIGGTTFLQAAGERLNRNRNFFKNEVISDAADPLMSKMTTLAAADIIKNYVGDVGEKLIDFKPIKPTEEKMSKRFFVDPQETLKKYDEIVNNETLSAETKFDALENLLGSVFEYTDDVYELKYDRGAGSDPIKLNFELIKPSKRQLEELGKSDEEINNFSQQYDEIFLDKDKDAETKIHALNSLFERYGLDFSNEKEGYLYNPAILFSVLAGEKFNNYSEYADNKDIYLGKSPTNPNSYRYALTLPRYIIYNVWQKLEIENFKGIDSHNYQKEKREAIKLAKAIERKKQDIILARQDLAYSDIKNNNVKASAYWGAINEAGTQAGIDYDREHSMFGNKLDLPFDYELFNFAQAFAQALEMGKSKIGERPSIETSRDQVKAYRNIEREEEEYEEKYGDSLVSPMRTYGDLNTDYVLKGAEELNTHKNSIDIDDMEGAQFLTQSKSRAVSSRSVNRQKYQPGDIMPFHELAAWSPDPFKKTKKEEKFIEKPDDDFKTFKENINKLANDDVLAIPLSDIDNNGLSNNLFTKAVVKRIKNNKYAVLPVHLIKKYAINKAGENTNYYSNKIFKKLLDKGVEKKFAVNSLFKFVKENINEKNFGTEGAFGGNGGKVNIFKSDLGEYGKKDKSAYTSLELLTIPPKFKKDYISVPLKKIQHFIEVTEETKNNFIYEDILQVLKKAIDRKLNLRDIPFDNYEARALLPTAPEYSKIGNLDDFIFYNRDKFKNFGNAKIRFTIPNLNPIEIPSTSSFRTETSDGDEILAMWGDKVSEKNPNKFITYIEYANGRKETLELTEQEREKLFKEKGASEDTIANANIEDNSIIILEQNKTITKQNIQRPKEIEGYTTAIATVNSAVNLAKSTRDIVLKQSIVNALRNALHAKGYTTQDIFFDFKERFPYAERRVANEEISRKEKEQREKESNERANQKIDDVRGIYITNEAKRAKFYREQGKKLREIDVRMDMAQYERNKSDAAWFSNLYRRNPFTLDDGFMKNEKTGTVRTYQSVEHAYQTWKSGEFDALAYNHRNQKGNLRLKPTSEFSANKEKDFTLRLMIRLIGESFLQSPQAFQRLQDNNFYLDTEFKHTIDKGYWGTAFPNALRTAIREVQKIGHPRPGPQMAANAKSLAIKAPQSNRTDVLETVAALISTAKGYVGNKQSRAAIVRGNLPAQNNKTLELAEKTLQYLGNSIDGIITFKDMNFDKYKGRIADGDKPVLLTYKGNINLLNDPNLLKIAVVGTLYPQDNVLNVEQNTLDVLLNKNAVIVSGLAKGCDKKAHEYTLQRGGKTIAILPSTIRNVYPKEHAKLAQAIVANGGLVISEYITETSNNSEAVARLIDRDRLQALFSDAVFLIASHGENDKKQNPNIDIGSRHALAKALEWGVPRLALQGRENDSQYNMNREIIANGAMMINSKKQLTEILDSLTQKAVQQEPVEQPAIKEKIVAPSVKPSKESINKQNTIEISRKTTPEENEKGLLNVDEITPEGKVISRWKGGVVFEKPVEQAEQVKKTEQTEENAPSISREEFDYYAKTINEVANTEETLEMFGESADNTNSAIPLYFEMATPFKEDPDFKEKKPNWTGTGVDFSNKEYHQKIRELLSPVYEKDFLEKLIKENIDEWSEYGGRAGADNTGLFPFTLNQFLSLLKRIEQNFDKPGVQRLAQVVRDSINNSAMNYSFLGNSQFLLEDINEKLEKNLKQGSLFSKLFTFADKSNKDYQEDVINYVNKVLGDDTRIAFEESVWGKNNDVFGSFTETDGKRLIRLALSGNVLSTAHHEAFHAFLSTLKKNASRHYSQILKLSEKYKNVTLAVLRKYDPKLAKEVEYDPEELATYTYQLAMMGALPINNSLLKRVVRKLGQMWLRVAGFFNDALRRQADENADVLTTETQLALVYNRFNSGQFNETTHSRDTFYKLLDHDLRERRGWDFINKASQKIGELADKFVNSADAVLRRSKIPELIEIADLFYNDVVDRDMNILVKNNERGDYTTRIQIERNRFVNNYIQVVKDLDENEKNILRQAMLEKSPVKGKAILKNNEKLLKAWNGMRDFFDNMYDYFVKMGVSRKRLMKTTDDNGKETYSYEWEKLSPRNLQENGAKTYRRDYFPFMWNIEAIKKNRIKFTELLLEEMQAAKESGIFLNLKRWDEKNNRYVKISVEEHVYDVVANILGESINPEELKSRLYRVQSVPFGQMVETRYLNFIRDRSRFDQFFAQNLDEIMLEYIQRGTKRALFQNIFGEDGEKIQELLNKARYRICKKEGLINPLDVFTEDGKIKPKYANDVEKIKNDTLKLEKIMQPYKAAIQAMEGTLGQDISPELRRINSVGITYQNFRTLCFALFNSFQDIAGLAIHGGNFEDAWNGFVRGVKEIKNTISKTESKDEWIKRAELFGVVDPLSSIGSIGEMNGTQYMTGRMRGYSNKFFRYIGLEGWNRGLKAQAMIIAERHIMDWKNNGVKNKADQLLYKRCFGNADPASIKFDEDGYLTDNDANRYAVNRIVRDMVMSPTAANRPAWMSNPKFMLFAHLKTFTYTLHRVLLRGIAEQIRLGNITPATAALVSMVPITLAGYTIKEMLLGALDDDDTDWRFKWNNLINSSLARSGIGGIPQMYLENIIDGDLARIAGPTVDQIQGWASIPFRGQEIPYTPWKISQNHTTWNESLNALPLGNFVKRWPWVSA